jgi:molybdopterin-binding protein
MTTYRMAQAAELLGVSDDTVRRWADAGRLPTSRNEGGRLVVDGEVLARFAQSLTTELDAGMIVSESARNRFAGIVTKVVKDKVMAQVELQAGRHRLVSLMSREAADELGLAPGMMAVAAVKATNVVVELPAGQ